MKTRFWNAGIVIGFVLVCVSALAQSKHRRRLNSGASGVVPIPPAFRRRQIRLSNGVKRRTFDGRSRFRAEGRGRLSFGGTAFIS